ncbi:hypothetical protein Snoj_04200 [Streptomyces nojiriensis]|uniref:Uncharacterized protein n=1 Tax=Streptomyces nojiriensis TaxID=66374 RepID=A0ABQ3SEK3_9ACTN|nr:hypothetical protein JYK04_06013 [Streptomyces nojiriensis]GGS25742.1 hypothetical protein GCM10010205_64670 [Streptomyces nojiriensis]GHI66502.1 hypothetical protein Snoj_04200 [Streptomyces nojiriensis]
MYGDRLPQVRRNAPSPLSRADRELSRRLDQLRAEEALAKTEACGLQALRAIVSGGMERR